ncbi:MAG TPA: APC family permease [Dehalococcoidia bacterium]|nr:APC family permease [Dehalococcoidia bacterium]
MSLTDRAHLTPAQTAATAPAPAKAMTVMSATFLGIGGMVGAGIFALLGEAGAIAGSAVWVSFLVAGLVALLQSYSFAKLGARFPSRGGIVEYLIQEFGNGHITGIIAWMFFFNAAIVMSMVTVSFASYAGELIASGEPTTMLTDALAVGLILVVLGINLMGPRLVARAQVIVVWLVIGILGAFAAVLIFNLDPDLLAPSTYPAGSDILSSVALTFFAYLGFNVIAFSAGDMDNPQRDLPRAMFISISATMVIYIALAIGVFGTLSVAEVIENGDTALAAAAKPSLGEAGFTLMLTAAAFSTSSAVNANVYASGGLMSSLAQRGQFPPFFARKFGPHGVLGLLISATLVITLSLLFDLSAIASMGSAVTLIFFALITAGHIPIAKKTGAKVWLLVLGVVAALATFLMFFFGTLIDDPKTMAALFCVLALSVGTNFLWKYLKQRSETPAQPASTSG